MATRAAAPPNPEEPERGAKALRSAAYPLTGNFKTIIGQPDNKRLIDVMLNGRSNEASALSWYFYERIPELRYIARYIANSLSQARLYVGVVTDDPYNPEPASPRHPGHDLLASFAGGQQGQSELLDRLGLHLTIPGDSILIGPTGKPLAYPYDTWRVFSTDEVTSRNGEIFMRHPVAGQDAPLPKGVKAVRIWRQHPRWWWEADSATRSAFSVLREIDLLDQHVHATAISRLSGAGILGVPDELTLEGTDTEGEDADFLTKSLSEIMSIAIKNRESAAALVPIIIRGPAEYLQAIQHFDFSTKFDERVPELRNISLRRLGLGMDVPPEILTGMSDSNHWSAWQTDESTVRLHTSPLMQTIVTSLTQGWFQPALKDMRGLSAKQQDELDRTVIWYNLDNLRVQPDIAANAEGLYDRFELGSSSLRAYSGVNQGDAPSDKELAKMILLKIIRDNNQSMVPYAVDALRTMGVPLPDALPVKQSVPTGDIIDDNGNVVPQTEPGANPAGPPTGSTPTGNSIPGDRSSAKQTQAPSAPPADGDGNNNG